jgi:hypothetical protein
MQIVELSDADLLARMKNFEDHLVERKTISDLEMIFRDGEEGASLSLLS